MFIFLKDFFLFRRFFKENIQTTERYAEFSCMLVVKVKPSLIMLRFSWQLND